MRRALGYLVLVVLMATTAFVPPWDTCWHADGSACTESRERCCGDEGSPEPAAPCPDCLDVSPPVAQAARAAPVVRPPVCVAVVPALAAGCGSPCALPASAPLCSPSRRALDPPPAPHPLRC